MAVSPPLLHLPYLLLQLFSAIIFAAKPTTTPLIHTSVSDQQRTHLVEALMGAQDFSDLANVLSVADPSSSFPLTATLFFPKDGEEDDFKDPITLFNNVSVPRFFDPAILGYHIVPQLLSFSDLQRFPIDSRLPTLIPAESIIVTNNSRFNYTINGVQITRPDLYIGGPVAVHGIASMLGLKQGIGDGVLESGTGTASASGVDPLKRGCYDSINVDGKADGVLDCDQRSNGSDAQRLWTEFSVFLSVLCSALGFMTINGYHLIR